MIGPSSQSRENPGVGGNGAPILGHFIMEVWPEVLPKWGARARGPTENSHPLWYPHPHFIELGKIQ